MTDKPPIDLYQLDATFGEDGRADLIETFLNHSNVLFSRINAAWDEKDIKTVVDAAHQMKGMGSSIYAAELSRQALHLEKLAKENSPDWQSMLESYDALKEVHKRVTDYLAMQNCN
ncbi:MAG: Hpt domain-containing protein [Candidatus Obscuribacterales bacterium]|nr:Hpt domain-containing protein [Candidatus Obscuribacterales bacterium]